MVFGNHSALTFSPMVLYGQKSLCWPHGEFADEGVGFVDGCEGEGTVVDAVEEVLAWGDIFLAGGFAEFGVLGIEDEDGFFEAFDGPMGVHDFEG